MPESIARHCIETDAMEKIPAVTHVTSLAASGKIKLNALLVGEDLT